MGDPCAMFAEQNRLEIRLLGTFQVTVDGRPAGTGGSKRDALLALLALRRGRPASVDALIDDLWGSDMPASPRNAVQHHVARLRATLGQDAMQYEGRTRSSTTDTNGAPPLMTTTASGAAQAALQHVVLTYDLGQALGDH